MATIENARIEALSVSKITYLAAVEGGLLAKITTEDKGISFDGHISLFDMGKVGLKDHLIGDVPVQVKGTQSLDFDGKFRLKLGDYKNFYKKNGCILFVGKYNANGKTEIYYKQLFPLDLKGIIGYCESKGQKSYSVSTKPLANTTLNKLLRSFFEEASKQNIIHIDRVEPDKFDSFIVTCPELETDPDDNIFDQTFYEHGVFGSTTLPIKSLYINSIKIGEITPIQINNEIFNLYTEWERSKTTLEVILEKTLKLNFNLGSSGTANYRLEILEPYSLDHLLKVIPLIQAMEEVEYLEIGSLVDIKFHTPFRLRLKNSDMGFIFKDLKRLYDELGIDSSLPFGKASNIYQLAKDLTRAYFYGDYSQAFKGSTEAIFFKYFIGDHQLIFHRAKNDKLKSAFSRFVSDEKVLIMFKNEEEEIISKPISIYLIMTCEEITANNANLDLILEIVEKCDFTDEQFLHVPIRFGLECIKAFDKCSDPKALELAKTLYGKLRKEYPNDPVCLINLFQTYKRERNLNHDEIYELVSLLKSPLNVGNAQLFYSVNVLLDKAEDAKLHFNKMDEEEKEDLRTYPIYHLYEKLINKKRA